MRSIAAGTLCVLVGFVSAQSETVEFEDASGLSGEATFTIVNGGNGLEVRYRNTSTGAPGGFSNSDQLMTSVSWDFGGVATITGGSAAVGPTSVSLNFDGGFGDVGPGDDVSGEFGYGNGGSTGLHPNFVGSNMAGNTAFGGVNLDGPAILDGPQAGLAANPPAVALGGLGAIQDEVVVTIDLSATITDLDFLENGVTAEYGSDAAFLDGTPACEEGTNALVPDPSGFNLNDGLFPQGGGVPSIGNAAYTLCIDDAADVCSIPPGSPTFLFLSLHTAELTFPGLGCAPGSPGTILLDPAQPFSGQGPVLWNGPGSPACYPLPIPDDPGLCGFFCAGQGLLVGSGPSGLVLTNRHELVIGS